MALKKSELYSSLWQSCDELRGGMDASQYKDYVLVLLFIKYISDKYAGVPFAPIIIPEGASFKDMVALKGKPDIGDQINKKIIAPLANANRLSDFPDFNDATKLGSGKEMVDRLTNLIAIFENPALDFSRNRADGDDILGDAYEYLMRHFATESGKSKGQFYTPAEVSRVIAQILGIRHARTTSATTVYDPTCGSGSLLLKVADEARTEVTLYGQEKDAATSGLARMNMILHNNPTALIVARYFAAEQEAITQLEAEVESVTARMSELEEEHGGEDGVFSALDRVNRASVTARLKEIRGLFATDDEETREEAAVLDEWLELSNREAGLKKKLRNAEAALDAKAYAQYPRLTEDDVKTLVVDDKWLTALEAAIHGEMERISQTLTQRVKELTERYETPMPQMTIRVAKLEAKVNRHLERMGFSW
jgi:hypothetical protein